ncbi:transposase [Oscillospiraceae bacterium 21-37]
MTEPKYTAQQAAEAGARKLQDSYFKTVVQEHFSRRWEPDYREALKQRQIWCEGTFAAQKWGHNLTRLLRRGLETAEDHCLLSAAALNLKTTISASPWRAARFWRGGT